MTQLEGMTGYIFDQKEMFRSFEQKSEQSIRLAETLLQICQLTIDFTEIKRAPRFCPNSRESDVEHSFMLALAGIQISKEYYPGFDSGLIAGLGLVHDFPELKTGDMPTFDVTEEELAQKHAREGNELPGLMEELPSHLADLLMMYEEQQQPEAIFIKHLDKLLPYAVDIQGAGIKVMNEDFGVFTSKQLFEKNEVLEARWQSKFTDPSHEPLHLAHSHLANKLALKFDEL